ncbi:YdcF family protein [Psychrobacillus lasiicapitis]|uniref:YdcF family protein n=1 Tax=Psychrobacillus lasiicapitis TaxID=1636719 RepID=A0A544T3C4_9BACI|nr:YdcF family protein [Psychrobacillus lasiicapitis]TQR11921.1 YdcF family protein [Psychrobacillus lasiicapitis]
MKNRSLIIFLLCITLILLSIIYFPRSLLIDFLFYEDEVKHSDLIILNSGNSERMKKVAELYHSGYADKVLLTNALSSDSTIEYAESFGISRNDILTENAATSTYESAHYTKEILLDHEYKSAIVVTSNFHMRRTRLAYERVYHDTNVNFIYVPFNHESITRDSWKENEELFMKEYKNLIGGYFLYFDGVITPVREWFEDE